MIAEFTIRHNGTDVVGRTSPMSVVETERRFDLGVTSLFLGDSPRMEALFWLLWRSLHPDASLSSDDAFDAWLVGVEGYDIGDELPPPPP